MYKLKQLLLPLLLTMLSPLSIAADPTPTAPYVNPYLAASNYAIAHARTNFSPVAGPVGPSRRLRADEFQWKPIGPLNATAPLYSGPYPNGKRVIWLGGYDRVTKLDADTLEVLTTYAIGGNTYYGQEEIERTIATMDRLDDRSFIDYNIKFWPALFRYAVSFYHLLSRDNEFYLPYRGADGIISVQVYGETDPTDPASSIVLRRTWRIPPEISKAPVFGMNMTPDGWIVIVTSDGTLIALSRDLATQYSIKLPRRNEEGSNQDLFSAFMRNGISIDDQGGIFVVTRDHMHRVQWTGKGLSLDEADGAWSAAYPNERGNGSGTTPGLMGWGPKEDHLVVIADGSSNNNAMVFWRDKIPEDWKGLPGYDRRVAGITPIHFGVSKTEKVLIENSPVAYGYGVFFDNTYPVKRMIEQSSPTKQWLADSFSMHVPGYEALGGAKMQWDPETRVLKQAWQTQTNFVSTVCTVSAATNIVYCWGERNREWTLEGTDWTTGKSAFHYILGKSHRFNPLGVPIVIAPNGAIDCGCTVGFGLVRVKPKEGKVVRK